MLLANFIGIYAVLLQIYKCRKTHIFGANFLGQTIGWCKFLRFLQLCGRMVWGTFLEKNFPSSNGHFLDFWGGLNPCPDGLGHFFRENGKKNAKIAPEKSAPECPFECGGGVIAIWAMPK